MKDLHKTEEYMGRAFFSLLGLKRVEGKEMELFSHSGKSRYGSIIVDLSVEQVKKNTSLEVRTVGSGVVYNKSALGLEMRVWVGGDALASCVT